MSLASNVLARFFKPRLASSGPRLADEVGQSAFDYIISSRDDLIAAVGEPVAGQFTLLSGSYAITASTTLLAGESLFAPLNTDVYIQGMGPGKVLTVPDGIAFQGDLSLSGLTLLTDGTSLVNLGVLVSAKIFGCNITSMSGPVLSCGDGSLWQVEACRLESLGATAAIASGSLTARILMTDCEVINSGSGSAVDARPTMRAEGCIFQGNSSAAAIVLTGGVATFANCDFTSEVDQAVFLFGGVAGELKLAACTLRVANADAAAEMFTTTGAWRSLSIIGCEFLASAAVARGLFLSSAGNECVFNGNIVQAEIAESIRLQSVPAGGITIIGNHLQGATPFSVFTPATLRVMCRGNVTAAGALLVDTAIVP